MMAEESPLKDGLRRWFATSVHVFKRIVSDPSGAIGLAIVLLLFVVAAVPGAIAPFDPEDIFVGGPFETPGKAFWFGTDELGRDVFSRVVHGVQVSLLSAVTVVGLSALIGITLGIVAGYRQGVLDDGIMRVADIFIAFPDLIMAMAVVSFLGPGLTNAMLAIVVIWWPQYARLIRGQVVGERERLYVEAAHAMGMSEGRILFRHILPNVYMPIVVKATLDIGMAVLMTASLSFLGLGATPPSPELGALVTQGREHMLTSWWYATFPGLVIFAMGFGFNMLGDALRSVLDPTVRRSA